MPHHPSEENAPSHIYDQVAKESSDSTASTHPLHDTTDKSDKAKASIQDFTNKGPQITENLPPAASKEELQAKARELNK
ncbi:hypothetical protein DV738_g2210, partial [Chaetothyriales sp. CBS 135597]